MLWFRYTIIKGHDENDSEQEKERKRSKKKQKEEEKQKQSQSNTDEKLSTNNTKKQTKTYPVLNTATNGTVTVHKQ